jgi:hypothetical protein
MPNHAETLKSMLQDIINDRQEQAAVTMHDYFVAKTREVTGLAAPAVSDEPSADVDPDQNAQD